MVRTSKTDLTYSTRNALRERTEKVELKGESTRRQVRHEPLHGELAKEGVGHKKRPEEGGESWWVGKEEVGKSNDKFLGCPRVPGVAGDNSRV